MKIFKEFIGWYGVMAILVAYVLVNLEVIVPKDLSYQLLNLSGSIGIIYISLIKKSYSVLFLNGVWAITSLYTLSKFIS
jgi:hypothetical protein